MILYHLFPSYLCLEVTIQDSSPPAAAHPGLEWVRAVPPAAAPPGLEWVQAVPPAAAQPAPIPDLANCRRQ